MRAQRSGRWNGSKQLDNGKTKRLYVHRWQRNRGLASLARSSVVVRLVHKLESLFHLLQDLVPLLIVQSIAVLLHKLVQVPSQTRSTEGLLALC